MEFEILLTQPHNHDRLGWPYDPDGSDRLDDTNESSRPNNPNGSGKWPRRIGWPNDTYGSGGRTWRLRCVELAQRPKRTRLVRWHKRVGGSDDPNGTDDLDESGGLKDKDGPNWPDNQDESVGPMTHTSLAGHTT